MMPFQVIHTDQAGTREWAIRTPAGEYLLYGKDCRQARTDCKAMNAAAEREALEAKATAA